MKVERPATYRSFIFAWLLTVRLSRVKSSPRPSKSRDHH